MDKISLTLAAIMGILMTILIAPNVLRMNQGRMLRNIALWLAIFLGLALIYRTTHKMQPIATESAQAEQNPTPLKDPYQQEESREESPSSTIFMPPSE